MKAKQLRALFETFSAPAKHEHFSSHLPNQGTNLNEAVIPLLPTSTVRDFWEVSLDVITTEFGIIKPIRVIVEAESRQDASEFAKLNLLSLEPHLGAQQANLDTIPSSTVTHIEHCAQLRIADTPFITAKAATEFAQQLGKEASSLLRKNNALRKSNPSTPHHLIFVHTDEQGGYQIKNAPIWHAQDFLADGFKVYGSNAAREPLYLFDK
ncbi:hypothetical protein [Pseudoalteromonas umbrosa]|uniref:hypothetical protein n=1 Tax=Pseudoalteromonas umbrosa TaxID=3048489 RepID=UPI0024C24721|nr:hypothetical protein [Pseudoalteromonas sp. B95]MDK1290245.1 hypothetical protein [Pseudoalteromonas sp. B95]